MIARALGIAIVAACSVASAKPRLEASASTGMIVGSTTSPVVYAPTPTARMPGDPGDTLTARASPYRAGVFFSAATAIQTSRPLSFGVEFHVLSFGASAPRDDTSLERLAWTLGPYVRGAIPGDVVSPHVAIGLRYLRDTQEWSRPSSVPGVTEQWHIEHTAVAVPVTVGVDIAVHEHVTIGPALGVLFAVPQSGCAIVSASDPRFLESRYCADDEFEKRVISTNRYAVWNLGVATRFVL